MTVVNTNIAETINITTNGEYNVARYTTANVNTPVAPAHYIEFNVDGNGKAEYGSQIADFTGITDVAKCIFYGTYYGDTSISGAVDMSDLTTVSGSNACQYMFSGCTGITSVDLSSLATISGNSGCYGMFQNCTDLTSINLSSLTTISGGDACNSMFYNCTGLTGTLDLSSLTTINESNTCVGMFLQCRNITGVDLSSLATINGHSAFSQTFWNCTKLASVDLSSLTVIIGNRVLQNMFQNCTSLTTLSFPALTSNSFGSYTNQFNYMLQGCSGVTVHFPSNLQSVIGSWSDVTAGFGGTNTTVLFDLPATE